jgi:hypothetical protein
MPRTSGPEAPVTCACSGHKNGRWRAVEGLKPLGRLEMGCGGSKWAAGSQSRWRALEAGGRRLTQTIEMDGGASKRVVESRSRRQTLKMGCGRLTWTVGVETDGGASKRGSGESTCTVEARDGY